MRRALHTSLFTLLALLLLMACTGCVLNGVHEAGRTPYENVVTAADGEVVLSNEALKALRTNPSAYLNLTDIPAYSGSSSVEINDGRAYFGELDARPGSYEEFAELEEELAAAE